MSEYVNQPSPAPTEKVKAGLTAGVIITLVVSLLAQFGVVIPEEVSTAVIALIGSVITIGTFLASYFKKNKQGQ